MNLYYTNGVTKDTKIMRAVAKQRAGDYIPSDEKIKAHQGLWKTIGQNKVSNHYRPYSKTVEIYATQITAKKQTVWEIITAFHQSKDRSEDAKAAYSAQQTGHIEKTIQKLWQSQTVSEDDVEEVIKKYMYCLTGNLSNIFHAPKKWSSTDHGGTTYDTLNQNGSMIDLAANSDAADTGWELLPKAMRHDVKIESSDGDLKDTYETAQKIGGTDTRHDLKGLYEDGKNNRWIRKIIDGPNIGRTWSNPSDLYPYKDTTTLGQLSSPAKDNIGDTYLDKKYRDATVNNNNITLRQTNVEMKGLSPDEVKQLKASMETDKNGVAITYNDTLLNEKANIHTVKRQIQRQETGDENAELK